MAVGKPCQHTGLNKLGRVSTYVELLDPGRLAAVYHLLGGRKFTNTHLLRSGFKRIGFPNFGYVWTRFSAGDGGIEADFCRLIGEGGEGSSALKGVLE